ncbi:Clavaminate synthase-like protein [Mollisia scopiformis]|uniref:Clavaminate synthase-like protein n=1 Tax=Mollisia scopiformis TaxID=149040 RepID=A0A194XJU4_MOLSC|nr:Clavaminate synthase-like protein [Mollisia scopiformis]KUJ20057.1 Clavaminate synthase-like protein [Mollisia scopiformis]
MSTTTTITTPPTTSKLELRTAYGPVYRDVLNTPPRDCTAAEIPIIDLSRLYSEKLEDRKALATDIRAAAINTGFFYIKNHGIEKQTIADAKKQLLAFFKQPMEDKMKISQQFSKYYNGYKGPRQTFISPGESVDVKESMGWRYDPRYDPDTKDLNAIPEEVKPWIRGEEFVWEGTSQLPGFKEEVLRYWSSCLTLARKLVKIFALSLNIPEDYFDSRTTYPGADGVFNYYPVTTEEEKENNSVGLGSHTDLQLFTLLWQDMIGGLQVLNKDGQWIKAVPVEGTIVVNIGDFMMRLCNDIYKSTVHRVYNRAQVERVSMPFFFGLNFNCVEGVIPSCASEKNPPKYEAMSCGDWCQLRFKLENDEMKKRLASEAQAPSALIVAA